MMYWILMGIMVILLLVETAFIGIFAGYFAENTDSKQVEQWMHIAECYQDVLNHYHEIERKEDE